MEKVRENMALIVTIIGTLILTVGGIGILIATEDEKISDDERQTRLIREDSNIAGTSDAKVEVVEFSDFQCSACAAYYPDIKQIKEDYADDIAFVYRHFPLHSIHPLAQISAEGSEAAAAQGKFWQMHDKLYENQMEWSNLTEEAAISAFVGYAEEIGISDPIRFETELRDGTHATKVNSDLEDAESLGLRGTPSIFVDGKQINDPRYENLKAEIEEALGQ